MTSIDKIPKSVDPHDNQPPPKIDLSVIDSIFKSPEASKQIMSELKMTIIATILFIILSLPMLKISLIIKIIIFAVIFYILNSNVGKKVE